MNIKRKLVILGGGTGLSTLLKGIKYIHDIEISAIVSVSDDGSSTGVLRRHFTIPAVGDIRKVISSLSKDRKELDDILEYRFENTNTQLDGHAIGNLIIVSQIMHSGSFSRGIANTCKMLNIQGKIIPVSNHSLSIGSKFDDDTIAYGESAIHTHNKKIKEVFYSSKNPQASHIAVDAILKADIIILGIGSLYTSIMPNIIFENMKMALKKTKSKIFYFANIFTESGETNHMSVLDHIKAIEQHTFKDIIDKVVINKTKIPASILKKYNDSNQFLCKNDVNNYVETIEADLLNFDNTKLVRHDEKLIKIVIQGLLDDICS